MRPRLGRPSPSFAISILALFVALGGTSYAAITITGKNVKNGSLTGKDIKKSSLSGANVKDRSLTAKDFSGSVVGSTGPAGPAGATGATGATGPKGDTAANRLIYQRRTILGLTGGGRQGVATVNVPAGTWHVQAKLIIVDANGGETDCFIHRGTTDEDQFYTNLQNGTSSLNSFVESMYGTAVVSVSSQTAIAVQCDSLTSTADARDAVLTATEVGSATAQ